jgi:hypothetical protein
MQPSYRESRVAIGQLLGLKGSSVHILKDSQDVVELPLEEVLEARIEVDWKSILKEGKCRQ